MNDTHKGRCHCGGVTLQYSGKSELTFFCHRSDCQRTTGAPFSVELMVPQDGFASEGNLSTYTVTGASGQAVHRRGCAKCGSALFLECDADPDYVFVKAGTLDDASFVEPEMHIFTSAKQPWVKIVDDLPQFERMPPQ